MNKNIRDLIKTVYNIQSLDIDYDITLRYNVFPYLYESCHETNVFDNMINDILLMITNKEEDEFYTGWNYIRDENICKKLNNDSLYTPIYIIIDNVYNGNYAEIADRAMNNDFIKDSIVIIIHITNNKNILIGSLKHELLHALEMYIQKEYNWLNADKNTGGNNVNDIFECPEFIMKITKNILYQLSLSELRAKINGTIGFLRNSNITTVIDLNKTAHDNVISLLLYSDTFNQLSKLCDIQTMCYKWFLLGILYRILIVGYYLITYKLMPYNNELKKLKDKNYILNILDNYESILYTAEDKLICKKIIDYIHDNRVEYLKKLYSSIYNNIGSCF